jgi:hypothetical protein
MEENGRKTEKMRDILNFAQNLHMPNFDQKSHIGVDGKNTSFFVYQTGVLRMCVLFVSIWYSRIICFLYGL